VVIWSDCRLQEPLKVLYRATSFELVESDIAEVRSWAYRRHTDRPQQRIFIGNNMPVETIL